MCILSSTATYEEARNNLDRAMYESGKEDQPDTNDNAIVTSHQLCLVNGSELNDGSKGVSSSADYNNDGGNSQSDESVQASNDHDDSNSVIPPTAVDQPEDLVLVSAAGL